ncbi:MAG TPA: ABC transporter substrate-binding protein [Kofleriaceae bacterium]|nr:ABC transporter substrate-binding protein [Kofleriaceae bacterium]
MAVADAVPRSTALVREEEDLAVRARRSHTLRIHMDAEPRSLHPLLSPSQWTRRAVVGTVFETLVRYVPPEGGTGAGPGRYVPGLARSWRIQGGGTEIILELDPAARFHDGKPFTAVDVQFTLDTVRDPGRRIDHLRGALAAVTAVEMVTSRSLRIRLSHPDGWVLRALAEIPMISYATYKDDLSGGGKLIGTGPYRVTSQDAGVVHLTRWNEHAGASPRIADIELVYQPDASAALMAAKRGELDIVPSLIAEHWPEQATAPGLATSFVSLELKPPSFRYVLFASHDPPTDDPRVRKALSLLVDRKALSQEVDDGLTRPIALPIWPGGPGDGPAPAAPVLDPSAAGRLLDEAGWIDADGDGLREKGGQKLTLDVLVLEHDNGKPHPEQQRVLDGLRRAGVGLVVRAGTKAVLENRLRDGDFNLAFLEWTGAVDSDLTALVGTGGDVNFGRFSSRRVDRALGELRSVWEPESRAPLMGELSAALADELPLAGLVAAAPQGLVHRRVQGVVVWDGWIDLLQLSLTP